MYSLSTIKRLTRTANLYFGTNYSPTQIYKNQQKLEARQPGMLTRDYATLISLPRTRADTKRNPITENDPRLEVGRQLIIEPLSVFASQSTYLSAVYNATLERTKIGTDGALYHTTADGTIIKTAVNGTRSKVDSIPAGAKDMTARTQLQILERSADALRSANKNKPGTGYDSASAQQVISEVVSAI